MDQHSAAEAGTAPQGYGTDPNLVTPHTPWSRTLSERERALVGALADIVLPGAAEYPAPSAMGIADFFDDWAAGGSPRQSVVDVRAPVADMPDLIPQDVVPAR
ncbi:hypothetical protein ABZT45_48930, partial [Streptomyces sp. NPDC005356]|uniref:hypothetical protein n=1 Tax=Streptomyces sp. NPDC005356 TaxID=3157167 RepID=UPI0033ABA812